MKIGKTLYITNRKAWRAWLAKNHKSKTEIWLVYFRKKTGKPRIPYDDAVEEALCYGWIDSIVKNIDKERFAQRFSVRKNTSVLSQVNKERIYKLITAKKMTKIGLSAVSHVFNPQKNKGSLFIFPIDIIKSLKADSQVWRNFQKFPEGYKRIRIAYIEGQKTRGKEKYQKTLNYFIKMTKKNKQFGFVKV
ncbi:MAG: YdeI/OmpD-associated family protein [Candidatus Paceibacterota bacterium]|jgi:uncharacterized protein YdeI (YjbR/CyaY-like superfamily)